MSPRDASVGLQYEPEQDAEILHDVESVSPSSARGSVRTIHDVVVVLNSRGGIQDASPSFLELTAFSIRDLRKKVG